MTLQLEESFAQDQANAVANAAQEALGSLIQKDQYVGEVYHIGYEEALVQIHDFHRQSVGGIPSLSFLVATRINPDCAIDFTKEDSSVLLLRVMDAASLPTDEEARRIRVQAGQQVSGTIETHWDSSQVMDQSTAHVLSYAGVKCRVIGTFFLEPRPGGAPEDLQLRFGSDLSNYYPNRGLKVYKPNDAALGRIVNYRDPDRDDLRSPLSVPVGRIRYASTNRAFQGVSNVTVKIMPADLLGAKTALFGMTRTGKSNTTKIIIQSVFALRFGKVGSLRIGQLVFDPNGEYANENTQDKDHNSNPSAVKNVWQVHKSGIAADVVTYGITPHPSDPDRCLMKLNFHKDENLQTGKEIINAALPAGDAKYIENFRQIVFDPPDSTDFGATVRYRRRVLAYRALLSRAGLAVPASIPPNTKGLFSKDILDAMSNSKGANSADHASAAKMLANPAPKWDQLTSAFFHLADFISDAKSGYQAFEQEYVANSSSGDTWADEALKTILTVFRYPNGPRLIGKVEPQHAPDTATDYAELIYKDLLAGRLVIVDQSSGDPEINQSSADRIMWYIFRKNQETFRLGKTPPDVLLYVEEAHNLLPAGSEDDLKNVWVRTAKEGAKYHIGLVYATQEVSSIQRNILKATANWFIGHLNNSDETKELSKYYDFVDFERSIRRAQDRGFLRVKTLSNLFVIPVQVRKFETMAKKAGG